MQRFCIVPMGANGTPRGPRYFKWRLGTGIIAGPRNGTVYGLLPIMLVYAQNMSVADDATLGAASDVLAVPVNVELNISTGAVAEGKAALDNLKIPAANTRWPEPSPFGPFESSRTALMVSKNSMS